MKKIVSVLLCAALMAGLCACGQKPVQTDPVKTVKSAEQLVHYGSYSDIYAALKKARELCAASGLWTLADDSGLEVVALHNAPGVYSARYAGEPCSYPANNAKLLRELEGVSDRRARFRCAIALCAPDGREWTVDGRCPGQINRELRGANGFGYDPLFVPDGFDKTFAELDAATKNRISHRGSALARAAVEWGHLFAPGH